MWNQIYQYVSFYECGFRIICLWCCLWGEGDLLVRNLICSLIYILWWKCICEHIFVEHDKVYIYRLFYEDVMISEMPFYLCSLFLSAIHNLSLLSFSTPWYILTIISSVFTFISISWLIHLNSLNLSQYWILSLFEIEFFHCFSFAHFSADEYPVEMSYFPKLRIHRFSRIIDKSKFRKEMLIIFPIFLIIF